MNALDREEEERRQRAEDRWSPSTWPWEMEVLTFLFFLLAVAAPHFIDQFFLSVPVAAEEPVYSALNELQVRQQFLGMALAALLYVIHICWAISTTEFITASASHLLAPTVFSIAAFLRMFQHSSFRGYADQLFAMPVLELLILVLVVQLLTFVLARNRMMIQLRRFERQDWDLVESSQKDGSYLKLILARIQPIFYPPRRFRACRDGIMIEGYSYLMPIPFREIERIYPVQQTQLSTPGTYLASSAHDLIGLKLYESDTPIFISPANPGAFFNYCDDRMTVMSYH